MDHTFMKSSNLIGSQALSHDYDVYNKQTWKTGRTTQHFSCLIWQICCLLWSFSTGHCDVRVVHPHIIISIVQACQVLLIYHESNAFFSITLSRKHLKPPNAFHTFSQKSIKFKKHCKNPFKIHQKRKNAQRNNLLSSTAK